MSRLSDVLESLTEAEIVTGELRRLGEIDPVDLSIPVNLKAVQRRRSDLERELRSILSFQQLDLIRYRVEQFDGSDPPAAAIARSIDLFQTLVTAVFDAVRLGPKHIHQPSFENQQLSALRFAHAPSAGEAIHFTIPNDRLLALESEFDITFDMVFELFAARGKTLIRSLAARAGIASVTAARTWAENSVQHGLSTTITWRRRDEAPRTVSFPHTEALLFRTAIDAVADDSVTARSEEGELAAIDEVARTFRLVLADGTRISGEIEDGFPSGARWTTRRWYLAELLRAERISYGTGARDVRWSLRGLSPLG